MTGLSHSGANSLGIAVGQSNDVACKLDDRALHTQTDAKEWEAGLTSIEDRYEHPIHPAYPEPTWHEQSMIL